MIRYCLVIYLALIALSFQNCNGIAKSTEFSFIEINALLIDSINTVQTQNRKMYTSLSVDESDDDLKEEVVRMRLIVNSLNNSIITVKDQIVSTAKHTSDKITPQKILIEENNANLLLEIAHEANRSLSVLNGLQNVPAQKNLQLFPNTNDLPVGKIWDVYVFKEIPLYEVVAMMNQWILNNEMFVKSKLEGVILR